jgi:hypothetical protein
VHQDEKKVEFIAYENNKLLLKQKTQLQMNKYLTMIRKIPKEKSNKMQQCSKMFIIPYLYKAQHV